MPAMQSAKALIGGPFALTNQDGQRMTDQDLRGKYMLVMFGYTFLFVALPVKIAGATGSMMDPLAVV